MTPREYIKCCLVRRFVIVFLAMGLSACSFGVSEWSDLDSAVVRLVVHKNGDGGSGTAFAVNDQGYYVTNHHVIEAALSGAELFAVRGLNPLKKELGTVVWHSKDYDLAVVRILGWKQKPLLLGNPLRVKKNHVVNTLGFPGASDILPGQFNPGDLEPKIKKGNLSANHESPMIEGGASVQLLEHNAITNGGNSGGPLVDECGRVVGVNTLKAASIMTTEEFLKGIQQGGVSINTREGAYFSVRVDELYKNLEAQGIAFKVDDTVCVPAELKTKHLLMALGFVVLLLVLFVCWMLVRVKATLAPGQKIQPKHVTQWISRRSQSNNRAPQEHKKMAKIKIDPETGEIIDGDPPTRPEPRPAPAPPVATEPEFTLQALSGQGRTINLSAGDRLFVGREPGMCSVILEGDHISRQHAEVECLSGGTVRIRDLNSTWCTSVQDSKCQPQQWYPIRRGEVLKFACDAPTSIRYRLA